MIIARKYSPNKIMTKRHIFFRLLVSVVALILFTEYFVYFFVIVQCDYPKLDVRNADPNISVSDDTHELKVMVMADTHLLGSRKGHWFDKWRREWQMARAFQAAMNVYSPKIVFVLGDLFDEGLWCSDAEFRDYVRQFYYMFTVPPFTRLIVVPGNHDMGFHYGISPYLHDRFSRILQSPPVEHYSFLGNHFVLINSMAMEGDGCFLCRTADILVDDIASRVEGLTVTDNDSFINLTAVHDTEDQRIHFPMYRESDAECNEPDEAPENEKANKFRERWDCLSKESSEMLFERFNPRVIMTGHTHHGCYVEHREYKAQEYTIPSFNWRNKHNPSFTLAVFTPNNHAVSKCFLPKEITFLFIYLLGIPFIIIHTVLLYRRQCLRTRFFKIN